MRKNCSDSLSLAILALVACSRMSMADDMTVTVIDRDGEPVPDVAVYIDAPASTESRAAGATSVMDQVDTQFSEQDVHQAAILVTYRLRHNQCRLTIQRTGLDTGYDAFTLAARVQIAGLVFKHPGTIRHAGDLVGTHSCPALHIDHGN